MRTGLWLGLSLGAGWGCSSPSGEGPLGPGDTDTDAEADTDTTPLPDCTRQAWPITPDTADERVTTTVDGIEMFYWMPQQPRAVVALFTGNNQDISQLVSVEQEELYNELAERDFGFFAVDARDAAWDPDATNNHDFPRVSTVRDWLVANTALEASTPVFAVGFSGGGGFLAAMSTLALEDGWDFRAASIHNGWFHLPVATDAYFIAHPDDPAAPVADIRAMYETTLAAGHDAVFDELPVLPVDPARFTKIPNIDAARSQTWFDEAVAAGLIDAQGLRLVDETDIAEKTELFETQSTVPGPERATHQLWVVWRLHIWASDHACEEVRFFEERI